MPAETLRERWCAAPKSKLTSPEIPKVLASWLKVCATSAFLSSALDGIQPTFKHTPPQYCFSTTATFLPSCAARMARSEERRVGKEWSWWWVLYQSKD